MYPRNSMNEHFTRMRFCHICISAGIDGEGVVAGGRLDSVHTHARGRWWAGPDYYGDDGKVVTVVRREGGYAHTRAHAHKRTHKRAHTHAHTNARTQTRTHKRAHTRTCSSVRDKHLRIISASSAVRSSMVINLKYVARRVWPCTTC